METSSVPYCMGQATPHVFLTTSSFISPDNSTLPPALYCATFSQAEAAWVIGIVISGVCSGVLLALGLTCLRILHQLPHPQGFWNQRTMLMLYVGLVMLLNAALEGKSVREILVAVFETRPEALTYFYMGRFNIVAVLLLALTDGLLVWRCYMVQKVVLHGKPTKWQHICWIIPLTLWFILIESAIINWPIAIAIIVCAILEKYGVMALHIGIPLQSCSSVLVIYQVAMDKALSSNSIIAVQRARSLTP
ncbi:hypothetical protein P691DRAFT_789973 [Macrolepiota fuliginosa MF-IS2]|uniref:Uncharacterized protein n=1 Tax=Macrolepiota fuliginosa MF-IS2 TaxID=1400762 RepID=A0A9P5XES1_9AGAR|nr:hypothetical protein P691DRAFT_789973 [Macrolepiota fuliginosa MF-IS2]